MNGTSNIEDFQTSLVRHLGTDLSDGKIDARKSVGGVVSDMTDAETPQNKLAKLTGVVKTHEATVVLETATNQLAVTRKNGEEIPASTVKTTLATNMAAMVNRNEGTQTTAAEMQTRMADVPVSANLRTEGLAAVENVLLMDSANPRFLELQQAYTTNKIATGMKESAVAAALQIPDSGTTTNLLTQVRSEARTLAANIMSSAINTDKLMTALRPASIGPTNARTGDFVIVSGGTFEMGCGSWQSGCFDNEKPVHSVTVGSFEIGKYEVTQKQWKAVMGSNPSSFSSCGDDCPVEMVTWNDTQDFIAKLNQQEKGCTYRLPTEAEWEYACRSGGKQEKYCGGNDVDQVAWYGSNSGNKTYPVGRKVANGLGAYDMSGNVWEWVADWYGSDYYASSPKENPKGPSKV
ncbi:MAG: SUMF1/EgtB/PvdO family nonheme iron enzyme, partial [Magnetococcales bacterium]|nr:SUMF1/EgtB/PvdO family nonheme iron enzyme [Magnetococcales bacterium]